MSGKRGEGGREGGKYDQLSCGERFVFIRFIRKVIFPTTLWKKKSFGFFCSFECIIITIMCFVFFPFFARSRAGFHLPKHPPLVHYYIKFDKKKLRFKVCPNIFFLLTLLLLCQGHRWLLKLTIVETYCKEVIFQVCNMLTELSNCKIPNFS